LEYYLTASFGSFIEHARDVAMTILQKGGTLPLRDSQREERENLGLPAMERNVDELAFLISKAGFPRDEFGCEE
jgi:hypothetical protein